MVLHCDVCSVLCDVCSVMCAVWWSGRMGWGGMEWRVGHCNEG